MSEPIVTIVSVDRVKISANDGVNKSIVTFAFDVPVQAYTVNDLGVSYNTGTIADSKSLYVSDLSNNTVSSISSKTVKEIRQIDETVNIQAEIDHNELSQEGDNRINIYGKSLDGTWSSYNQS
jgi:hypothetical protein